MEKKHQKLKTWVEISKKSVKSNLRLIRSLLGKNCRLMAVVKSNAYGHGFQTMTEEVLKAKADWLGVDDLDEALCARKINRHVPILVFGYIPPARLLEAARAGISVTISNFEALAIARRLSSLKIHIKVDTGLGRQGFLPREAIRVARVLKKNRVIIEGVYSHFASVENPRNIKYSCRQASTLMRFAKVLKTDGYNPLVHIASSAAVLLYPEFHLDMVRSGISVYGLWPSEEIKKLGEKRGLKLKPALTWKTIVSEVKTLPKGSGVGYDLSVHLKRKTRIAVLPVGYWHGYPRSLSNRGVVLVRGQKARVLGRVCMDMAMINVSDISGVRRGDEVVLIGRQGKREISVEELAKRAGTINYEIVTRINQDIQKVYN
ncbi:MAG: alanine racemase [Parcubacteria group bacterium GW2011_GWA2_42_18]|nr:MAG: alanine racemase [Parcubacteria group bacterium GW2011_GWA2_42_18]